MNALLVGRFQPFHNGHMAALRHALARADVLLVGIGSSNAPRSAENPYSAAERREMISRSLSADDLARVRLYDVPDADDHGIWMRTIDEMMPRYDTVFTNDEETSAMYAARGLRTEAIPFCERAVLSGTAIRALIASGGGWRRLVPAGSAGVIERAGGRARLASL